MQMRFKQEGDLVLGPSAFMEVITVRFFLSLIEVSVFCIVPPFTFSIEHLGDVQELLSHIEGGVQVANGVVLQKHRAAVKHGLTSERENISRAKEGN